MGRATQGLAGRMVFDVHQAARNGAGERARRGCRESVERGTGRVVIGLRR